MPAWLAKIFAFPESKEVIFDSATLNEHSFHVSSKRLKYKNLSLSVVTHNA